MVGVSLLVIGVKAVTVGVSVTGVEVSEAGVDVLPCVEGDVRPVASAVSRV